MTATPHRPPSSTVVICTRDRPALLARMLESVRRHAPGVDVLVVDSASTTEETRRVAEAAGVGYLRVHRPGLSIARNAGVDAVDTDVVVFTDDDCVVADDWTAPLVEPFADPRVGVVTGVMLGEGTDVSALTDDPPRATRRTADGLDLGHGANMAFRRVALREVGGFDERLGAGSPLPGAEDLDAFCRLLHVGWVGVHQPRSAVLHRNAREGDAYRRLVLGYARGTGAALAKMVRIDGVVGAGLAWVHLRRLVRRALPGPTRPEDRRTAPAHARGLAEGLVAGFRMPVAGSTFVPEAGRAATDREVAA